MNNIKIFSLLLLFLSGCYQVDSLDPVERLGFSPILSKCEKESNEGPFVSFGSLNSNFNTFLNKYVRSPNGEILPETLDYSSNIAYDTRIDYQKILEEKEQAESKELRYSILGHIKKFDELKDRKEKIAALLNAYNFIAIDIVIQDSCDGLINTISDLGGISSFKAFSDAQNFGYQVGSEKLSLDNIEKDKIAELTNYEDARTHFAVICASEGCPVLLHTAYTGADLEEQLDFITRAGLRLPRMFTNNNSGSFLSEIFNWYEDDFISDIMRTNEYGSKNEYIQDFVKKFSAEGTTFNLNINYIEYDWSLNKL